MTVSRDGQFLYRWPVSTGGQGYNTPSGTFTPFRMSLNHHSQEYDNAPMPHSIFFTRTGDAIHGTYEQRYLGRPASHGCVRLSPQHAAVLWGLVKKEKMANTKVVLSGHIPGSTPALARTRQQPQQDDDMTASAASRYQGDWGNQRVHYDDSGRAYYEVDQPPPSPGHASAPRRDRYSDDNDNPFAFLFGQ